MAKEYTRISLEQKDTDAEWWRQNTACVQISYLKSSDSQRATGLKYSSILLWPFLIQQRWVWKETDYISLQHKGRTYRMANRFLPFYAFCRTMSCCIPSTMEKQDVLIHRPFKRRNALCRIFGLCNGSHKRRQVWEQAIQRKKKPHTPLCVQEMLTAV